MSVWLTSARDIGASLLLTCINILVAMMLMSLGLFLALAVSIQARCSRLKHCASASSHAVRASGPTDRRSRA